MVQWRGDESRLVRGFYCQIDVIAKLSSATIKFKLSDEADPIFILIPLEKRESLEGRSILVSTADLTP